MASPRRDNHYLKPAIDFISRVASKLCGPDWAQITIQKFMSGNRFLMVDGKVVDVCFLDECCIDLSAYTKFKACGYARVQSDGLVELERLVVDLEFDVR